MRQDGVQQAIRNEVVKMKIIEGVFIPAARFAPPKVVASPQPVITPKVLPKTQPVATTSAAPTTQVATSDSSLPGVSNGTLNGVENGIGGGSEGTKTATMKDLFQAELRAKIDQNKSYPSMSKRLGQQGEVVVAFTVLKDGSITNLRVDSASRFDLLNKSAEEAVKKVKKFKPIPKELGLAQMDLRIPIRYSLTL